MEKVSAVYGLRNASCMWKVWLCSLWNVKKEKCTYILFWFGLFTSKFAGNSFLRLEQRVARKRAEDARRRLPLRRTQRHLGGAAMKAATGSGKRNDPTRCLESDSKRTAEPDRVRIASNGVHSALMICTAVVLNSRSAHAGAVVVAGAATAAWEVLKTQKIFTRNRKRWTKRVYKVYQKKLDFEKVLIRNFYRRNESEESTSLEIIVSWSSIWFWWFPVRGDDLFITVDWLHGCNHNAKKIGKINCATTQ